MKIKTIPTMIVFSVILAVSLIAISGLSQSVNLVKEEMLALDPAFKKIIDAVVLGDMRYIKPALTGVHEARENVEKAVKAGQKITLQKNQDKFKEFVELDDKFHEELEILVKAAEAANKKLVKDQTHKLLDACVICHERYMK